MNEILPISLERLNNGAHYTFHTDVLTFLGESRKVASKLSAQLQTYKACLEAEGQSIGLSRKSFYTDEIVQAGTEREALYMSLKKSVKSAANLPDEASRQASKALAQLLKDYHINIRAQQDEVTGLLTSLVGQLQDEHRAEVITLGLGRFVDALYLANERLSDAKAARNEEASHRRLGVAKKARQATDQAYRLIVKLINSYALTEGTATYAPFILLLNSLILRYKQQVIGGR
jgi:hypothetical protein